MKDLLRELGYVSIYNFSQTFMKKKKGVRGCRKSMGLRLIEVSLASIR